MSSYTSNDLNQYTAIHSSEVWNPTYDLDGNLLNDGKFQYTWNGENRLIGVETHPSIATATGLGEKAEYTYDYQGRRIERKKYSWNNGSFSYEPVNVTNYVYDAWNCIYEKTVNLSDSSETVVTYTWGLDLSGSMQVAGGVGGMLSTTVGSDTYYPVFDANGNIMYYLDNNADTVASYTYDPFGSIHAQSGGRVDVFSYKFSTKPQDDVSGLYYYGFRFYDPVNGRWPSKDPIGEEGGVNLYEFVLNDPINLIDVLGGFPIGGNHGYRTQNYPPDYAHQLWQNSSLNLANKFDINIEDMVPMLKSRIPRQINSSLGVQWDVPVGTIAGLASVNAIIAVEGSVKQCCSSDKKVKWLAEGTFKFGVSGGLGISNQTKISRSPSNNISSSGPLGDCPQEVLNGNVSVSVKVGFMGSSWTRPLVQFNPKNGEWKGPISLPSTVDFGVGVGASANLVGTGSLTGSLILD